MATHSGSNVRLKGPAAPPPLSPPPQKIDFCHPHYDWPDVLFRLPRLDSADSASTTGVHHGTALLACQIVANNAFEGFLATDRAGLRRVTIGRDEILTEDMYWFIADPAQPGDNYPLVPRFEDWEFPHVQFPKALWRRQPPPATGSDLRPPTSSDMPPPNTNLDPIYPHGLCIISNASYMTQYAHVVPKAAADWFNGNHMGRYSKSINSSMNRVYMRHDLHNAWDLHKFVLVPKCSEVAVHILDVPVRGCEFAAQWHNTTIRNALLEGRVADEYLFAKFARAIFLLLKPFIIFNPTSRRIVVRVWSNGKSQLHVEQVAGDELNRRYGGGGTIRSTSVSSGSRKRSRSQATQEDDEEHPFERNVRQRLLGPIQDDSCKALSEDQRGKSHGGSDVRDPWEKDSDDGWYDRNIAPHLKDDEESDEEASWYDRNIAVHLNDDEIDEEASWYDRNIAPNLKDDESDEEASWYDRNIAPNLKDDEEESDEEAGWYDRNIAPNLGDDEEESDKEADWYDRNIAPNLGDDKEESDKEADWYGRNIAPDLKDDKSNKEASCWYDRNIAPLQESERGRPRERPPLPPSQRRSRDRTIDTVPSLITDDSLSLDAHEQDGREHGHVVHNHKDPGPYGLPQDCYGLPSITSAKIEDDGQRHVGHSQQGQQSV